MKQTSLMTIRCVKRPAGGEKVPEYHHGDRGSGTSPSAVPETSTEAECLITWGTTPLIFERCANISGAECLSEQ